MELERALNEALAHHGAGRLAQATAIYQQILAAQPNHARVMHLLGVAASQRGEKELAVQLITRAIQLAPGQHDFHSNLALVLIEKGQPDAAIAQALRALELLPSDFGAQFILANALTMTGRADEAARAFTRALELRPNDTDALRNFARLLQQQGKAAEAAHLFRRALQLRPDWADAHVDLGDLLRAAGQTDDALACFDRALAIDPRSVHALNGRGLVLHDLGRLDAAMDAYRRSIELDPRNAAVVNNLGFALEQRCRYDEARQALEQALALRPDQTDAVCNLANTLRDLGRWDEAMRMYRRGLRIQPDNARVRFNHALMVLLLGDYARGWEEYEWRWLLFRGQKRTFAQPRWLDTDLGGKRLLVWAEQGLGDAMQFVRYLPMLVARAGPGARVIFECHADLFTLLRDQPVTAGVTCIPRGHALPEFDHHVPLMSLPLSFGTTVETVPRPAAASRGYVKADEAKVRAWRERIEQDGAREKFRVGLAWGGDPTNKMEATRSVALSAFAPLANAADAIFYSLQKGPAAAQAKTPPPGMTLIDHSADFKDFSDTAALTENLDLIVTVDTAIAHLGGSLGKRTWTLLPFNPDFRWLLDRADTPWYPTMRLFRPRKPLDWAGVFADVAAELRGLVAPSR